MINELEHRHSVEKRWHDEKVRGEKGGRVDLYAMGALDRADDHAWTLLGDVSGKTVVDFGCGVGQHAIRLARQGARVYAFDISPVNVQVARRNVSESNLQDRVSVDTMAAEQLTYLDGFADRAFGHSILHHTDLALTRQEAHRILKPDGRAVFLEPLGHNPLIRVFRALTPSRRTPTERPLRFEDVLFFAEPFSSFHHTEFYLVALAAFVFLPLRRRGLFQAVLGALARVDNGLLTRWPEVGKYAWVTVMGLVK